MALINCPNCNNLVSDKAVKCPKCGIELTPVESVPENEAIPQVENVEPISQVEPQNAEVIQELKEDHTLRYILLGMSILLFIGGGICIFSSINKGVSKSSNLDIDKILEEVDRDMAAKSYNEALEKQNAEKRLEEFKNFKSNDLAAFMLHGKVKKVTSYSGQCYTKCEFNESGILIYYEFGDNHSSHVSRISHEENKLTIIHAENSDDFEVFEVVGYKLMKNEHVGGYWLYSEHDSNNWAKSKIHYECDMDGYSCVNLRFASITYSDIDQYGNWTTSKDEDGYTMESREIEYYPF